MKTKIVVITGAFQGSGKELVKQFLNKNYKVYCLDIKFKKLIKQRNKVLYGIDLSKLSEIKNFIQFLKKEENHLDCLINNAGISLESKKYDLENYLDKTLKVNLYAAYFLSELALPLLKKSKNPSILNISSIAGKIAMKDNPAYNISKAGLSSLSASQAFDFSKFNIRSNSICPGYIKTNMTKKSFNNRKMKNERLNRLTIKKYGSSKDLAHLAIYLCSKEAGYINGQEIIIDGGFLKKGI